MRVFVLFALAVVAGLHFTATAMAAPVARLTLEEYPADGYPPAGTREFIYDSSVDNVDITFWGTLNPAETSGFAVRLHGAGGPSDRFARLDVLNFVGGSTANLPAGFYPFASPNATGPFGTLLDVLVGGMSAHSYEGSFVLQEIGPRSPLGVVQNLKMRFEHHDKFGQKVLQGEFEYNALGLPGYAVPEPGAVVLILLGLSLLGIGGVWHKRRRIRARK